MNMEHDYIYRDTSASKTSRTSIFETDAEKVDRLQRDNAALTVELATERSRRKDAEERVTTLEQQLNDALSRKRRTKAEMATATNEYNPLKSDGKPKAKPAEPIRSYEDFAAIQNYFWSRGKMRDWALWTIGVSLGLRISDLLSLKISAFLDENSKIRPRVVIIEQKTHKLNNCLITPSVVDALMKYFDSIDWKISRDDYLFPSGKTKGKMYEEYGWKILSDAGKALGLPINIGSHTMRKSFANIAACVDKQTIDMNAITKIQGLLNHSNQQVTMRYLNVYQEMFDRARLAVSDFVLGKTNVNILAAGNGVTLDDIISRLDEIDSRLPQTD